MACSKQITPKSTPRRNAPAKVIKPRRKQLAPDLISDLSDCILIHILSFLDAKEAVQTCILSKRWINLWKTLPTLVLLNYPQLIDGNYEKFVHQVLSLRDNATDIHSLQLHPTFFKRRCNSLVTRIMKYVFSHNVQHLLLSYQYFKPKCFSFSCSTLKSLRLTGGHFLLRVNTIFPNSLNFPSLSTLSLTYFTFSSNDDACAKPFSTFDMLNTLVINQCIVLNDRNLCISNTKLENLSITMYRDSYPGTFFEIELCAPNLRTFSLTSKHISNFFGDKSIFSCVKQLSINVRCFDKYAQNSSILLNWLNCFANIEALTVDIATLEVFLNFYNLFEVKPPSLVNLKSLKIETYHLLCVPPFDKVVNFLLQNSPSANVETIIVDKWSKM
ncbi:F-box/LRR-repeat protein At3g26922-like isoform X1 [Vicia villosa]|uniref:F-box/LRR-repeat protein At3g26922-like isoform X1 n=1 Tax=Vicia villosa TaxID=3911 RepID=UPI00273B2427|nr:F-box/LRR-repeat protein At3g26922-like isoform X1 [Vicia villosa]